MELHRRGSPASLLGCGQLVTLLLLLAPLLVPPPAHGQLAFPSTDVVTCSSGGSSSSTCETKLLVQWVVYGGGSNLALSVQLDKGVNFTDQYGRPWGAAQPITIQLSLLNSRIEYGMTYRGMYRNAYEKRVPTQQTSSLCPASHKCCSDVSYFPWLGYDTSLAFNETSWYGYALGLGVWKYDLQVALSQGTLYQSLFLNSVTQSASLNGIAVTLLSPQLNQNKLTNYNYNTYMLPTTNSALRTGFLVPDGHIGILPNQIGVVADQWLAATQCGNPLGLKTMVQSTNPYDQFAAFRSSSLEAENPTSGCVLLPSSSNANPFSSSPLLQTFACPDVGSMRVYMEVSAASYKLQALYGVPLITNSGLYALGAADTQATIFLDCSNSGTYDGVFTFQPVNCCVTRWPSTTCSGVTFLSASTVTVPPLGAARVTFVVDSRQVMGANGTCLFDVLQHARVEQRVTVVFETSVANYLSGGVAITNEAPNCFSPYVIVQKGNTLYCVPPCTQDQDWDASLYGGVPWGDVLEQTYMPSNNTCVNQTISFPPPANCTLLSCFSSVFTPVTPNLDCGDHGTYANHSCSCSDGYTNVFGERVNDTSVQWCSTLSASSSSSSIASSLTVAVVALALGLGLCCCGFVVSTGILLLLQARARRRWTRERLAHLSAMEERERQLITLQLTAMNNWPRASATPGGSSVDAPLPGSQRFDDRNRREDDDESPRSQGSDDDGDDDDVGGDESDDEEAQQQPQPQRAGGAGEEQWHQYYNTGYEGDLGPFDSATATTRESVRVVSGTLPIWQQRLNEEKKWEKERKEKEKEEAGKGDEAAAAPQAAGEARERGWRRGRRRRRADEMATLLRDHLNFLWTNLAGFTRSPSPTVAPPPAESPGRRDAVAKGSGSMRRGGRDEGGDEEEEDDRPLPPIPSHDGEDERRVEEEGMVEVEMMEMGEMVSPVELLRTMKARQVHGDAKPERQSDNGGTTTAKTAKQMKKSAKKTKKKGGTSSAPANGLLALVDGYGSSQ